MVKLTNKEYIVLLDILKNKKYNLSKTEIENLFLEYKQKLIKLKKGYLLDTKLDNIILTPKLKFINNITEISSILLYGAASTYKSFFALKIAEHLSSLGYIVIYINTIGNISKNYIKDNNIHVDDVIFYNTSKLYDIAKLNNIMKYISDIDVLIYDDISVINNKGISFTTLLNLPILKIFIDQIRINFKNESNSEWYNYLPSNKYAFKNIFNVYQLKRKEPNEIAFRNMVSGGINVVKV